MDSEELQVEQQCQENVSCTISEGEQNVTS
jgi:hypothetical protein